VILWVNIILFSACWFTTLFVPNQLTCNDFGVIMNVSLQLFLIATGVALGLQWLQNQKIHFVAGFTALVAILTTVALLVSGYCVGEYFVFTTFFVLAVVNLFASASILCVKNDTYATL